MDTIGGFPACRAEFDKSASLVDPKVADGLSHMVQDQRITDLLVVSHGWNNDMQEAAALYEELLTNVKALKAQVAGAADRVFGVLAVFWPSKKFADADLIPGGAASLGAADEDLVRQMLEDLKGAFDAVDADAKLEQAKQLVDRLEDDPAARKKFADLVRNVVNNESREDVDRSDTFFSRDGAQLIEELSTTGDDTQAPDADQGGAADLGGAAGPGADEGGAQGLGDFFGGLLSGARNVLNFVTYYQMKERAGLIGSTGLNPVVSQLRKAFPRLKVHLIGHSFGGRLVAATAHATSQGVNVVCDSLMLLQAAFSHYGFSDNWDGMKTAGFFRNVVADPSKVAGPVLITCTRNDQANGIAYAIASRLAGQVAAALGDENDKYGAIGRNGAQKTPNTISATMVDAGGHYDRFMGNRLYNVLAGNLITSHGDVRNRAVAYAILSGIASS